MSAPHNLVVFIPAKNESATIAEVIRKSRQAVTEATAGSAPTVLVIDDGSTDGTSDMARKNGATVITHVTSRGLGTIFQDAVTWATEHGADVMLTIDGDGQFHEKDILNILKPILDDTADFVTGSRFSDGSDTRDMPGIKRWGNRAMSRIVSSILRQRYLDVSCGFRAYNRTALLHLNLFGGFTYTQEVFLNLGYKGMRIREIPITVSYFKDRTSRIAHNLFSYGWQVIKIILLSVIQYRPLRFFGTLALLLFAVGAPVVAVLGVRYAATGLVSPFKAIGIVGLLLVVLGIFSLTAGLFMQVASRIQFSIDRALYYEKRKLHDK